MTDPEFWGGYPEFYHRLIYPADDSHEIQLRFKENDYSSSAKEMQHTVSIKEIEAAQNKYKIKDVEIEIFVEKIDDCYFNVRNKDDKNDGDPVCNAYLSFPGRPTGDEEHEWKRGGKGARLWYRHGTKDNLYSYIWNEEFLRGKQLYYDNYYELVYCMDTKIAKKAIAFGGMYEEGKQCLITHQNITSPLWYADRYWYIKNILLYGQDNEFNIFRSLCFLEVGDKVFENVFKDQVTIRLSIGLLCLILQILLTIGIVIEVIDSWDIEGMFDNDIMIITISFVSFAFISYTTLWTVIKYFEFYNNAESVMKVSLLISFLDFVSNIMIGVTISVVSFFYLLQSESITDVVLNSFALTFIMELDDIANLFESDEDVLMENDWAHSNYMFYRSTDGDYNQETRRREVSIPYKTLFASVSLVVISPLFILACIYWVFKGIYQFISVKMEAKKRDNDCSQ